MQPLFRFDPSPRETHDGRKASVSRLGAMVPLLLAALAVVADAATASTAMAAEGGTPAAAPPAKADAAPAPAPAPRRVFWQEQFTKRPLPWLDPFDHDRDTLARVYSLRTEGAFNYLHAHYDGASKDRPPAMHYGQPFQQGPAPLDQVASLEWKWRVTRHPAAKSDAWEDCAAGIYVIIKQPSMIVGGRGFKFGWLAKPGPTGTHQHGLLQVPLRSDPAGPEWRQESVDLCALYRREYGACEGQKVLYVGVVTDGDGTKTLAEADYANFTLVAR
ncbi:hypothetical protein [Pendulispora albinea]|uniref:DUF3047 domain-containing protein n=1 Tax=Pendulispora albinea TaxID=2741071 RepID=A0ABZ2LPW1_9BACT